MVRIRYIRNEDGSLRSKNAHECSTGSYKCSIFRINSTVTPPNGGTFGFRILRWTPETDDWTEIKAEGEAHSLGEAKKSAKAHIKNMGVTFLQEVRRKKVNESQ